MSVNQATRATPRMDLGKAIEEFYLNPEGLIATKVFPVFATQKKAATFSAITRESMASTPDAKRGTAGNYNRINFDAEDKTYACQEFGLENALGDDERELYASDFDAEMVASKLAASKVLMAQEKRVAAIIQNTTTFTGAALFKSYAAAPWSTVGSDIKLQINFAKGKMRSNCGMSPNALILSHNNFENLKNNSGVKAAIQYTRAVTDQELANIIAPFLGLKYILVGGVSYNSATEGQAFVGADIWGDDYVNLAVIAENGQDLSMPAIGRTFQWVADCPENVLVEQYRDEAVRSDVFRARQHIDSNLIDSSFGFMLKVTA